MCQRIRAAPAWHAAPKSFAHRELSMATHIDRRSFLHSAGKVAVGGLTAGAVFEMMRPNSVRAQPVAKETHAASARVLEQLRTRFTFQISVDVATLELGRTVAGAALAGGVTIVEMGTPLLKNQGVANVVRSEEHTTELQSQSNLVCRLQLEKKKKPGRPRADGS